MNTLSPQIFFAILILMFFNCSQKEGGQNELPSKPNVLFIAVDDLRPELGCYGAPVKSPNIDRLANEGVQFNRHYVQFAVCIPSRAALLTSLRSERTHQKYGPAEWQKVAGVQSWGNAFRQAGYKTYSLGKIWHLYGNDVETDTFDITWKPHFKHSYALEENQQKWINFRALRSQGIHW